MRFTFLLPSDNLTGGTRVVAVYARALMDLGHDVLVVTCAPDTVAWKERLRKALLPSRGGVTTGAPAGHIALSGVPHKVMDRTGPIWATDLPDSDYVVATWWETAEWMHSYPQSKGRQVHLIQGYEVWGGPNTVDRVHAALRLPNTKITISNALAHTLRDVTGDAPVHVVPNAVDLVQFQAPPRVRNGVPRVGFIYAHANIKGSDICIEAIELARREIPDLEALAFGTDMPTEKLPLPKDCKFVLRPPQAELRNLYSACDFWLFGSRLDSFGLPILESMACRTPVIGVPIGAAPELIAQGGGVLVDFGSARSMADAIIDSCQAGPAHWLRLSEAAHRCAHTYSWKDATQRFLAHLPERF